MRLVKITKPGRYFIALPMMVFGIQHFLYAEFVVLLVPAWIPGPLFWTYLAGVGLFASGLGIAIGILSRLAALLLGIMITIWVVTLHIPRVFQFPGDKEFINLFDAVFMLSGAYLLSGLLPGKVKLEKIAATGAKLGPYLIALSLLVFGIENLMHGKLVFIVGAPPIEVPGERFWVYGTSLIFIGTACGIFLSKRISQVMALLGLYIFFIAILFYVPLIWNNIYDGHAWATFLKGIAISGSSFVLSMANARQQALKLQESIQV